MTGCRDAHGCHPRYHPLGAAQALKSDHHKRRFRGKKEAHECAATNSVRDTRLGRAFGRGRVHARARHRQSAGYLKGLRSREDARVRGGASTGTQPGCMRVGTQQLNMTALSAETRRPGLAMGHKQAMETTAIPCKPALCTRSISSARSSGSDSSSAGSSYQSVSLTAEVQAPSPEPLQPLNTKQPSTRPRASQQRNSLSPSARAHDQFNLVAIGLLILFNFAHLAGAPWGMPALLNGSVLYFAADLVRWGKGVQDEPVGQIAEGPAAAAASLKQEHGPAQVVKGTPSLALLPPS